MWLVSKYGKPLGWCRKCGFIWTPEKERPPTPAEINAWRIEQEEHHRREIEKHARALHLLQSEHVWEAYHAMLDERARKIWNARGIFEGWQDEWKLGINWQYEVWYKDSGISKSYYSPALSIPIWQAGGNVANVKMRVLEPRADHHRYRQIYETGNAHLFVARQDMPMKGKALVIEGEIKAMVTAQYMTGYQVIGLPSVSPDPELYKALDEFDEIVLCLDPDAFYPHGKSEPRIRVAINDLGRERVRVLRLPMKIDDAIITAGANPEMLIRQARKI